MTVSDSTAPHQTMPAGTSASAPRDDTGTRAMPTAASAKYSAGASVQLRRSGCSVGVAGCSIQAQARRSGASSGQTSARRAINATATRSNTAAIQAPPSNNANVVAQVVAFNLRPPPRRRAAVAPP